MEKFSQRDLDLIYDRGILNEGDTSRILKVFSNARSGKNTLVSFIGGSITQGCSASSEDGQYTRRVYKWFCDNFPSSSVTYLNAPVGGTDSQFGVARVDEDILLHRPDILFIEFTVNDKNEPFYMETYEGLIRKVLSCSEPPAVVLVMNCMFEQGFSAQDQHLPVGITYNLPVVSMKESFFAEIRSGRMDVCDISADGLHPNDYGHELLAGLIIHCLEKALLSTSLPEAITSNRFQNSRRYQNKNCTPVLDGFVPDYESQKNSWYYFADGWTAGKQGDSITFNVTGSIISVQYRKSANHPAPIASVVIDEDEDNAVILDANFDQDWGDCLYLQTVADNLKKKKHSVTIKIIETHENDTADFYLVSLITA